MSNFGIPQMYQCQSVAYNARDNLVPKVTDSTPDSPPSVAPLDLAAICALKKSIVTNLPTTCAHCNAEYPPGSIIERRDGDIVAYCKLSGACGKSRVLFAPIDLSVPVYEKICRFKKPESAEPEPEPTFADLAAIRHVQYALNGIVKPDVICVDCGKRYDAHEDAEVRSKSDSNGWVERRRKRVALPDDWPRWNGTKWN